MDNNPNVSLEATILYKLGSIETELKNIGEKLNQDVSDLKQEVASNATRIKTLEDQFNAFKYKCAGVILACGTVWTIFGNKIAQIIGL